jgi:hypothetical protein
MEWGGRSAHKVSCCSDRQDSAESSTFLFFSILKKPPKDWSEQLPVNTSSIDSVKGSLVPLQLFSPMFLLPAKQPLGGKIM